MPRSAHPNRFHTFPRICLIYKDLRMFYRFQDFRDLSRFHYPISPFYLKRSLTPIVLDPPTNNCQWLCPPPPVFSKFSKHWPSGHFYWSRITKHFISCFLVDIGTILTKSHSCFLVDIGPTPKNLKNLLNGCLCFGARLFEHFPNNINRDLWDMRTKYALNIIGKLLIFV